MHSYNNFIKFKMCDNCTHLINDEEGHKCDSDMHEKIIEEDYCNCYHKKATTIAVENAIKKLKYIDALKLLLDE